VIDLAETQRQFAAALLDASAAVPAVVRCHGGRVPERRFAVHRNNVIAGLISALAVRFPVVHRLVGDDFFRAMARAYVIEQPPRSPVLLHYGETLPGFIENFGPAASIEYLADVARLELARGRAYHAADAAALDAGVLASLGPEELDELRVSFHPSVSLLESPFPVVSIWEAHQTADVAPVTEWVPEAALVGRPTLEVEVWRLPPGGHTFLAGLAQRMTLTGAAGKASALTADFDLVANLAILLRANVIVQVEETPRVVS